MQISFMLVVVTHQYCGKLWFRVGWIMLFLSVVIMLLLLGKEDSIGTWGSIICMIQCFVIVGTIFPTERALKSTFDKNGLRKNN